MMRYDVLQDYAQRNRLDYNELCRVVREAVASSVHPNHRPALRYVLMVLEKAQKHQPFDEQERQELAAAITGMRYIDRTEQAARGLDVPQGQEKDRG